jgi:hypothetical protein
MRFCISDNLGNNTNSQSWDLMFVASWLIDLIWSSEMLWGKTYKNWEAAPTNYLPVGPFSQSVRQRKARSKGRFLVSAQHRALCGTTFFCIFRVLLYTWLWQWISDTHRMHCCVSAATMVTRTRHSVRFYVHCLPCYNWDGVFTARYVLHSTFCPHNVFMCFVWISEQTAIISLYNINGLAFITKKACVY